MKNIKKLFAIGLTLTAVGAFAVPAFASPANPGVPARDGSGGRWATSGQTRVYDGQGRGQGGAGRGLGIGGMMLQDGSCYVTQ